MNNHIMKQMTMSMRQETVDEYLKRGGTITKIPKYSIHLGIGGGIKNDMELNP